MTHLLPIKTNFGPIIHDAVFLSREYGVGNFRVYTSVYEKTHVV